jgi:hypothetical protein
MRILHVGLSPFNRRQAHGDCFVRCKTVELGEDSRGDANGDEILGLAGGDPGALEFGVG